MQGHAECVQGFPGCRGVWGWSHGRAGLPQPVCPAPGSACFKRFLDYCYGLRFTETPNYDFLRALFFGARLSENITVSSPMDLIEDIRQQVRTAHPLLDRLVQQSHIPKR